MNLKYTQYPRGIRPYYIGLSALGVFAVVLLLIVLIMGASGKQDVVTAQKATQIADKLNTYTESNFSVPANLSAVGVKDVPSTISYKKLSSTAYKFCVTYKAKDTSVPTSSFANGLSEFESGGSVRSVDGESADSGGSTSFLDVSSHHKGQNCQTISLDDGSGLFDSGNGSSSNSSGSDTSGTSDPCVYPTNDSSDAAYQKYIDCENNYFNGTNTNNSSNQVTPTTPSTKT